MDMQKKSMTWKWIYSDNALQLKIILIFYFKLAIINIV